MKPINSSGVELNELVKLFYHDHNSDQLGRFHECSEADLPLVYRSLLAHEHHMTVTAGKFHDSPIELEVLATRESGDLYARKILLRRSSDNQTVLFGIVRIDLSVLDREVRQQIEARQAPLGQVLIDQEVLRQVKLMGLYRVDPGQELTNLFALSSNKASAGSGDRDHQHGRNEIQLPSPTLYGRTAIIFCDGRPVIELLEIVAVETMS